MQWKEAEQMTYPQPQGFLALPSAGKGKDLEEGARNDHKHREFVLK